jgi:hypothetical protein
VIIGSSVTTIGDYAFSSCGITSVTIPDSVITIGEGAFYGCSVLTSIKFLGLVAPTNVGNDWIKNTPDEIRGHAYAASNFNPPGRDFGGLTMGTAIGSQDEPPVDQNGNDNTNGNDGTDNKGTPGFELVFALCAIGIMIIAWRRKKIT